MDRARRELFGYSLRQLTARRSWCFWPMAECTKKAIRAHSIQNSRVLDLLCRDGHVIMPELDLTADAPPNVDFRSVGRHVATTFTGLCRDHDQQLFAGIETRPIDISDAQHLFLLAYRAVLKEAHSTRKSAIDVQASFLEGVKKGIYPKDEPSPPGVLACDFIMGAYLVDQVKAVLDSAYLRGAWKAVSHEVFVIEARPSIAVNSMFSTDLYSSALDLHGPAFVTLNVFPVSQNETAIVFSFVAEQRNEALTAFGHIWDATGSYQQYELSKLILKKAQNVAISPAFFDTLSDDRRRAARQYFVRNMAGHSYELEHADLFLFWSNGR